ncbi:MAG: DegT/DnrJ/EryC1/StrS family aminotransferase [Candidatus Omnitrophica bacterium]|nr:DegT/DnrJ/EryC1/StrS family aminotransferase [Candidatus Omnitrophota bacterium]
MPLRQEYRVDFGRIEVGEMGRRYLAAALDRHWISEGPNVRRFEESFAQKFGYRYAVATSSGTDAGIVAMTALLERGAARGDEVITPALAFVATANCVLTAGLVPKFVDVELSTLNINPALIERAITPRTRAIQVVHTMGKPCRMEEILAIAKRRHLTVLEDCCEAHGATLGGKGVGSFGEMALFSFYTAHIICSAEGGMVVTEDPGLAALCRSIRSHGRRDGELYFHFDRVGFNSKMNDLEAAVGLEGLSAFDSVFEYRRTLISRLLERLSDLEEELLLYREGPEERMCPHAFSFVLKGGRQVFEGLIRHLDQRGIEWKLLFGCLPTQHRAFQFLGYSPGDFPTAERLGEAGITLGIHQYLTPEDIDVVAECIHEYFKGAG